MNPDHDGSEQLALGLGAEIFTVAATTMQCRGIRKCDDDTQTTMRWGTVGAQLQGFTVWLLVNHRGG